MAKPPKYSNKYPRRNNVKTQNQKQTINPEQPMAKENTTGTDDSISNDIGTPPSADTHENFLKEGIKGMGSDAVTLEPANDITANPHAQAKIHRDYALDGIRKQPSGADQSTEDAPQTSAQEPSGPPEPEFQPTPPQEGDAPEQEPVNASDDGSTEPFDLPTGTAEELIESGAKALNYLIDNYGDLMVGIKIHQDFYSIPNAVPQIKEQNKRNIEKVKLNQTEINMLKKPLVKIMQEKGIRGLTPGEELIVAVVIIVAGKARAIYQIRQENKKLENNIIAEIRSMKKHNAKYDAENSRTETHTSSSTTSKDDDDAEFHEAEEVE
jgi:hypothetical protein